MGHTFISSKGQNFIGDSGSISPDSVKSPYSFLSSQEQNLHQSSAPFYLTLTDIDPDSSLPYRLTVISPGYYLYTELDREEYKRLVLNRGQHMHNTYEIEYTRMGEFFQQIEARRYKFTARSCCLLNRNIRHKEEYDSCFSTIILSLSYSFLESLFNDPLGLWFPDADKGWRENPDLKEFFGMELQDSAQEKKSFLNFTPIYELKDGADAIHDIFDRLTMMLISPAPGSANRFRAEICQLFALLSDPSRYSTALINLGTETESRIFSQITELIEQTHGRINRAELTDRLNYSGNYLNRIVRKYSGMNISQYGNYFAMQQASRRLLQSDHSVSEICAELGFTDRTHFYELFRQEFGVTPKEYRERERKR